jgi:enoyl-CoA hydratase
MEYALTREFLDARRAHGLGLVNRLTDVGGALDGALALAAAVAANGPLAVGVTKQIVAQAVSWPADEVWERQQVLVAPVFASQDAQEGARAFAEKRPAQWTGR